MRIIQAKAKEFAFHDHVIEKPEIIDIPEGKTAHEVYNEHLRKKGQAGNAVSNASFSSGGGSTLSDKLTTKQALIRLPSHPAIHSPFSRKKS